MAFANQQVGTQSITNQTDLAIGTSGKPIRVFSVHMLSSGTASVSSLKNGTTTGGAVFIQLDGIISKTVTVTFPEGLLFPLGCFADVDANAANLTVAYSQEF